MRGPVLAIDDVIEPTLVSVRLYMQNICKAVGDVRRRRRPSEQSAAAARREARGAGRRMRASEAAGGGAAVCRGVTSRARVLSASRRRRRAKCPRECSMRTQCRRRRRASPSVPHQWSAFVQVRQTRRCLADSQAPRGRRRRHRRMVRHASMSPSSFYYIKNNYRRADSRLALNMNYLPFK